MRGKGFETSSPGVAAVLSGERWAADAARGALFWPLKSKRHAVPPGRGLTPPAPGATMGRAMHTIFKDFTFSAAHAIRGHTRGCQNLHGHNYRVRVHLQAERLDALGMVLDFADLKAMMQEIVGPFDHRVINDIPPFDERNTTAELITQYVFEEVERRLGRARSGCGWPGRGVGDRHLLRRLRALTAAPAADRPADRI